MGSTPVAQPKIQLERLLATHYQHPNLADAERFFVDFGLHVAQRDQDKIYFRGFGVDPYIYIAQQSQDTEKHFVGGTWVVRSATDLELARQLPRASTVQESPAPGGGKYVEIEDPVGFKVILIHGIEVRPREEIEKEAPDHIAINSWKEKQRKGVFQRFDKGSSRIHKCGHYGIVVEDSKYAEMLLWYLGTFNLSTTDTIYNPKSGKEFLVQLHVEKAKDFVDHHVSTSIWSSSSESSMTTEAGQCWFDASGNMVKHYCDGDLINCDNEAEHHPASPSTMFTWGPMPPMAFLTGRVEDAVGKA
ncbi:MAG: hypothetical protein Q9165_003035 [Trypethelium subeluteriae]